MIRIKQLIGISLLALTFTSCATTNYKQNLQQASLCCTQFSSIAFKKLPYNKEVKKALGGEGDNARLFKEGKSFYYPVELPPYEGAFEIQIKSTAVDNKIFIPRILLLNNQHKVVKRISSSRFILMNGTASHKFFVNQDLNYRYMILYTAPQDLGKTGKKIQDTSYATPIHTGGFVFYYKHGSEKTSLITSSEGGQLAVTILKYKPTKIIAK